MTTVTYYRVFGSYNGEEYIPISVSVVWEDAEYLVDVYKESFSDGWELCIREVATYPAPVVLSKKEIKELTDEGKDFAREIADRAKHMTKREGDLD